MSFHFGDGNTGLWVGLKVGEHSSLDCPFPHSSAKETSNIPQSMNFKYKINQIRSSLNIGLIRELRMNPPNGALLKGLWDVLLKVSTSQRRSICLLPAGL